MVNTLSQLYLNARKSLIQSGEAPQDAGIIARNLLSHYSGKSHESILADRDKYACEEVCTAMEQGVQRVISGEPLAYVLGEWDFFGMTLCIDSNVLIPRDDSCAVTTLAVNQALFMDQGPRILDLCTGSGCIGLAIANRVKDARVTLADISPAALQIAKKNTALHRLSGRVSCIQADAMKPAQKFLGKFDMIVSNPPYITGDDMKKLPDSVKNFEPHLALYGGADGLDFYRAVCQNFTRALKAGGYLCFEYGMGQGEDVCNILKENGYLILARSRDFNDRERAVIAQYGRKEEQYGY